MLLGAWGQQPDIQPTAPLEKYEIDAGHSTIGFAVRHMGLAKVHGRFDKFSGEILYDPEEPTNSSVALTIDAASVNSNHMRRDADVRGGRLLDVEQFPEISFVSSGISRGEEGFEITGDLTLHGVTREVSFPFELFPPADVGRGIRLAAEGRLSINRKDYGIEFNRVVDTGSLLVGNTVTIELSVQAIRASE
jgi:polyisoprenoid-binding protein YceI